MRAAAAAIQDRMVEVCRLALDRLEPAEPVWAVGEVDEAVNRRERTADGRTILGWNPSRQLDTPGDGAAAAPPGRERGRDAGRLRLSPGHHRTRHGHLLGRLPRADARSRAHRHGRRVRVPAGRGGRRATARRVHAGRARGRAARPPHRARGAARAGRPAHERAPRRPRLGGVGHADHGLPDRAGSRSRAGARRHARACRLPAAAAASRRRAGRAQARRRAAGGGGEGARRSRRGQGRELHGRLGAPHRGAHPGRHRDAHRRRTDPRDPHRRRRHRHRAGRDLHRDRARGQTAGARAARRSTAATRTGS